jgi:uroporphyrinogen-III synthase
VQRGFARGQVWLLRAEKGNPVLREKLLAAGADAREVPVYETLPLPYEGEAPDSFDFVLFTSASGAESFAASCRLGGFTEFSRVRALCIGPADRGGRPAGRGCRPRRPKRPRSIPWPII